MIDYELYWAGARPWREWLGTVVKYADLWHGIDAHVRVPDAFVERLEALRRDWRILVLSEDWCGDAVNLVPLIAALGERARNVEVRVTGRDANPDLMNAHLTAGTRSIPVAIVLDERGRVRGMWGPRPGPVQDWFDLELSTMTSRERYPLLRGWYARDRGRTTLDEIVTMVERAERDRLAISA